MRERAQVCSCERCLRWRHAIHTHAGCCIAPHMNPGADACQRARLVPVVARCAVLCCAVRCCTSPVASRARGLGAHRPPCAQWPPLWRRRRLPATQTQEHARSIAHHPGCSGHARTIPMEFYGRRAASLRQRNGAVRSSPLRYSGYSLSFPRALQRVALTDLAPVEGLCPDDFEHLLDRRGLPHTRCPMQQRYPIRHGYPTRHGIPHDMGIPHDTSRSGTGSRGRMAAYGIVD
jgi:hypothetical protein